MSSTEKSGREELEQLLSLEPANKKKHYLRKFVVGSLVILSIAFVAYKWFDSQAESATEYRTTEALRGDLTITVTATGNLEPTNQVDVGSEVSGTIESVAVDYNDVVTAGQVLARLDTTMLKAQVNQSSSAVVSAQANLLLAQANVLEAQSDLDRLTKVRKLSGGKIPSIQDFDTAVAALKRAQATEAMIKANISQAEAKHLIDQTNLKKATILSPINGVVLVRNVDKGQTVAASLQAPVLFTLAEDLTKMELHVAVDEADVGQVKAGQKATFTVDAYPDHTFPATITQVRYGSQQTAGVVTYLTVLDVDNSDLFLRPGMTATADIIVQQINDALLVPNAALRFAPPQKEEKQVSTEGGSLLSKLFPRPRRNRQQKKAKKDNQKKQRIWTLRNDQPFGIDVMTGVTSGTMTEITSGEIAAGTPLIIESISKKK